MPYNYNNIHKLNIFSLFTPRRWRSTSSAASSSPFFTNNNINKNNINKNNNNNISLPPLRCPGGPRVKAEGIKQLFKVPHAGFLAKYDQRFILNLKLTHQIVSHLSKTTLKTNDKLLLELGPGAGALTRSLLTRPCVGVVGIEMDKRFNVHLEQIKQYTNGKFQWVNGDILNVNELDIIKSLYPKFVEQHQRRRPDSNNNNINSDNNNNSSTEEGYEGAPLRNTTRERILRKRFGQYSGFHHDTASNNNNINNNNINSDNNSGAAFDITDHWWSNGDAKLEVIANLPFNIITELLMRYACDCSRRQNIFIFGRVPLHIFTQKEIAERIIAPAGSIHFSRLSVLCQCFFHINIRQTFREMTYYPKTNVLGCMLTLQPKSNNLLFPTLDAATLIHFTDLIMKPGNRGITIYKALHQCVPGAVAEYMLQEIKIDGALNVLDLNIEEICKLAVLWQRFLEASSQQSAKS